MTGKLFLNCNLNIRRNRKGKLILENSGKLIYWNFKKSTFHRMCPFVSFFFFLRFHCHCHHELWLKCDISVLAEQAAKQGRQILFQKAEYILVFLQQRKETSTDMCVDHSMSVSVWVLQLIINGQAKILETKEEDMYKDVKDVLMISSGKPVTRHLVIHYFVFGFIFWWIQVHFFLFFISVPVFISSQ